MPTLSDYHQFNGRHWETGTVHNYFAHRSLKSNRFQAPHSGEPYSEALLLGVSGGITVGYFNFAYEGYDPQCNILTRNTFDPWDTMLSRLGVVQNLEHTLKPDKAVAKLIDTLEDGVPAIVWPDMWGLPYNGFEHDEGMWGSFPLLVYGYEDDVVHIADRAGVGLTVTPDALAAARGRIKKDKFRLLTLEAPDPAKVTTAVHRGICDTVKLMTEKPPKGSANNFGLKGLQFWANMLTKPKQRKSWAKLFPAGVGLYAGLTTAYNFAFLFGKGTAFDAERGLYADFLDEAAVILNRPALTDVAELYRASAAQWAQLPAKLLPDDGGLFQEARQVMTERHTSFLEQGNGALAAMKTADARLAAIRQTMLAEFPLDDSQVVVLREEVAAQLLRIRAAEETAVLALSDAIA